MGYTNIVSGETRELRDWSDDLLKWGKDYLDATDWEDLNINEKAYYEQVQEAVERKDLELLAAMNDMDVA